MCIPVTSVPATVPAATHYALFSAATAFPALTTKRRKQLFLANPLGGGVGGFGTALGGGSTVVDGSFGGGAFLVKGVLKMFYRHVQFEDHASKFTKSKDLSSLLDQATNFKTLLLIHGQQWSDLSSLVASVSLSVSKDRWLCDLSSDGEFKVKVVRNYLDDLLLPSQNAPTRWVKCIPIKVNVFAWRARRDRLPTRLNLSRRGVAVDSSLCPLCDIAVEDNHHVFFCCNLAKSVIRKICLWWDLDSHVFSSFSDWDGWFLFIRMSSSIKSILECVFCVAWWRLWMFQNQLIFDASPPRRSVVFDDIVSWSFFGILIDVVGLSLGTLG
ncbi:RNA-directed DNA polymerase, eukaryota [Tanacetum coccineum]